MIATTSRGATRSSTCGRSWGAAARRRGRTCFSLSIKETDDEDQNWPSRISDRLARRGGGSACSAEPGSRRRRDEAERGCQAETRAERLFLQSAADGGHDDNERRHRLLRVAKYRRAGRDGLLFSGISEGPERRVHFRSEEEGL